MQSTSNSIYRLGQVVANDATTSWGISWTFDTWGNRLTQTPQGLATNKVGTQTLGYSNNRLTTNTYDATGNQTNDGLHNYTFSAENQITQMDGGAAVYAYDGEGRRMKKNRRLGDHVLLLWRRRPAMRIYDDEHRGNSSGKHQPDYV